MKLDFSPSHKLKQRGKGVILLIIGMLFFSWLLNTPGGVLGKADAVGYAVCHRFEFRSFHLGDRPLPLCARCSGMYLGAVLGLAYFKVLSGRKSGFPGVSSGIILGLLVASFGVDGLNSLLSLTISEGMPSGNTGLVNLLERWVFYQPQNWLRLLTGTGMGLVMAAILFPAFNQTVWKRPDPSPAIPGPLYLMPLFGMALLIDLAVLSENPILLYPLAIASAFGVLLLLSMVYAMIGLMLFKAENHFDRWSQLIFPLAAGFGLAIAQIYLIDLARFTITQTWGGFPLP